MPKHLAETLRAAIGRRKKSSQEIARKTGVPVTVITRFMQGGDMRLKNASKIAAYLGLELKKR